MDSRKESILEAIVREYIETGLPVGSLLIARKYSFPFSPATIRAEMSELERANFLTHPHTSAGRIPTEKGYRYFVNMIEQEERLLDREGLVARKRLESFESSFDRQLETASRVLSELTRNMGFAGTRDELYSHGLGNLFSYPELLDPIRVLKTAELIDNLTGLIRELPINFGTKILIGSEVPIGKAAGCSVVISEFDTSLGGYGYLGIVGPTRMSYEKSLSAINEIKIILEEGSEKRKESTSKRKKPKNK
jgi:heat-inducible transcriptional repressor